MCADVFAHLVFVGLKMDLCSVVSKGMYYWMFVSYCCFFHCSIHQCCKWHKFINTMMVQIFFFFPFNPSGDAGEDAGDLDFSALLKKR